MFQAGPDANKLKITFLGDSSVGKSTIIYYLIHEKFSDNIPQTVGLSFYEREYTNSNAKKYTYVFNDLPGTTKAYDMMKTWYRFSNLIVLVYDVTSTESYDNIKTWYERLNGEVFPIILVGNKADLDNVISPNDERYNDITQYHIHVSAKTGEGVSSLKNKIIELASSNLLESQKLVEKTDKKGCC